MRGMFTQMAINAVSQFSSDMDQQRMQAGEEAYRVIRNTPVETCKAALEQMRSAYICAPGRYLIIWTNSHLGEFGEYPDEFEDAPADPAGHELSDTLLTAYQNYLADIALRHDSSVDWRTYFHEVLHNNYAGLTGKPIMSRQDALRLGHALRFTVEEMDDFLLRVLEQDDGFSFTSSSDLIEMFCFATQEGTETVQTLKKRYREISKDIEKAPLVSRTSGFTEGIYNIYSTNLGIQSQIEEWRQNVNVSVEDQFLEYLKENAANLDNNSRSAYIVYRNLADEVYNAILTSRKDPTLLPIDGDVKKHLRDCYALDKTLSANEAVIARTIVSQSGISGRKGGFVDINLPKISEDGSDVSIPEPDEPRLLNRMIKCLTGQTEIMKADILILLWYYFSLCFSIDTPATLSDTKPRGNYQLSARYDDFTVLADEILAYAFLPSFYQPHLLETAISYSLCSGDKIWSVYCDVMETVDADNNSEDGCCSEDNGYSELVSRGLPCIANSVYVYLKEKLSKVQEDLQFQFNADGIYVVPSDEQLMSYDDIPISGNSISFLKRIVSTEQSPCSMDESNTLRQEIMDAVRRIVEQSCKDDSVSRGGYNISSDQRINRDQGRGPYIKVKKNQPESEGNPAYIETLCPVLVEMIELCIQQGQWVPSPGEKVQFIFETEGVAVKKVGKKISPKLCSCYPESLNAEESSYLKHLVDITSETYQSLTTARKMLIGKAVKVLNEKYDRYKFTSNPKGRTTNRPGDPAHGPLISVSLRE